MVTSKIPQTGFAPPLHLYQNPTATSSTEDGKLTCGSRSGYEIFAFKKPSNSFIWEGVLTVEGMGKLGLVSDMDANGNGYYISFDTTNGVLRIRGWGFNPLDVKQNFIFNDLQYGVFSLREEQRFHFRYIRYGNYIELSIDGAVKLTLIDYAFSGDFMGLYSASSVISLQDSVIKVLPDPRDEYASQEESGKIME